MPHMPPAVEAWASWRHLSKTLAVAQVHQWLSGPARGMPDNVLAARGPSLLCRIISLGLHHNGQAAKEAAARLQLGLMG